MSNSLKLSLCAVGGFLLGLFVGSLGWTLPDVKVWEARVARYQRDSAAYERMLATFAGERARLEDSARASEAARVAAVAKADVARALASTAKQRADSLLGDLSKKQTLLDTFAVYVQALDTRTEEATAATAEALSLREGLSNAVAESLVLRGVINTQDSVIARMTNRLAIADDLLRDRPQTDRCRVLWFNCPSRTASFVVGAVAGIVGGVYVALH